MRMWMAPPESMCRKHLLGEHVELHMYLGAMRRRTAMYGYLDGNLLEPAAIYSRHEALAAEMGRRGYRHRSPMTEEMVASATRYLTNWEMATVVDKAAALAELHRRCPECAAKYSELTRF